MPAEGPAPFIRIGNVSKAFGQFQAVNNVSLEIAKGEMFALLGGSGCGKTTLLRMLAGFETPSSGRIFIDGQDMTGVQPYDRPVNMMFQSYALFPHMTVEGNVGYGLKHEQMSRAERADRVREQGSGLVRYGAAMYLYQRHDIAAETLEVFRICAPDDKLDPLAELQRLGLHHDIAFLKEISPDEAR